MFPNPTEEFGTMVYRKYPSGTGPLFRGAVVVGCQDGTLTRVPKSYLLIQKEWDYFPSLSKDQQQHSSKNVVVVKLLLTHTYRVQGNGAGLDDESSMN